MCFFVEARFPKASALCVNAGFVSNALKIIIVIRVSSSLSAPLTNSK